MPPHREWGRDIEMRSLVSVRCRALLLALLVGLVACSSPQPAPAVFDFGPRPTTPAPRAQLQLLDVTAPPWLAGSGLAYRLEYRDPFRREVYRDSRWAAPPADLLAERLRQRAAQVATSLAATGVPVQVRVELEDCSQIFSSPIQSRVVLRLRAWRGDQASPKVFEVSEAAPSPDAAGAVQGLSRAADALIDQVLAWAGTPP